MSMLHEEEKEKNKKLEAEVESLKATIENLANSTSELSEQNAILQQKVEQANEAAAVSIPEDISADMKQYTELKKGAEQAIEKLRLEKEELKKLKVLAKSNTSSCGEFGGEDALETPNVENAKLQEEIDVLRTEMTRQDTKYKHKLAAYHKRLQELSELLNEKTLAITILTEKDSSAQAQIAKLKQLMRAMKLQYDTMKQQLQSAGLEVSSPVPQRSQSVASPSVPRSTPSEM